MKKLSAKKALRIGLLIVLCVFVSINALALYVVWKPKQVITYLVNKMAPGSKFTAESIHWKNTRSLVIKNAQIGDLLKIPQITLEWEWKRLWNHHFKELKISNPQIFVDIGALGKLGGNETKSSGVSLSSRQKPWFLDRLVLERGGLLMVGLGPTVPPLNMEIDGSFEDIPLGENLSKEDLEKIRTLKLKNIHIHSPLDLAVTLLMVDSVVVEMRIAGLREKVLDSLVFYKPTLDIDRGFFWFVEELRRASAEKATVPPADGKEWKVKLFKMVEGRLDINRLRELQIQYPFDFETTKEDMPLKNLSLADFRIPLNIRKQNFAWPEKEIYIDQISGKIDFNLGAPKVEVVQRAPDWRPSNDVVNTLYVDAIRWKKLSIVSGWLSLTFDPKAITGMYGGAFADGYISGGMNAGWSGNEPWRTWGSAADIDVKVISDAFSNESFGMNGRAEFAFDATGHQENLKGDVKLKSLTTGVMELRSLDNLLKKVDENTVGIKKELLNAFISSLRDYPYLHYELTVHYDKPNAQLVLQSDGERGARNIKVNWHGLKY